MKFLLLLLSLLFSFTLNAETIHMLGDSIFATSNHRTASEASRLSGKKIIDHSTTGAWMIQIVDQYRKIRGQADTIIMDGGGNDVLGNSGNCRYNVNDKCRAVVDNAINKLKEALQMFAEDNVSKLIFVGVHYPRKGNSGYEKSVDYAYTRLAEVFTEISLNYVFIDGREILNADNLFEWDGVHPNWEGTSKMGERISQGL